MFLDKTYYDYLFRFEKENVEKDLINILKHNDYILNINQFSYLSSLYPIFDIIIPYDFINYLIDIGLQENNVFFIVCLEYKIVTNIYLLGITDEQLTKIGSYISKNINKMEYIKNIKHKFSIHELKKLGVFNYDKLSNGYNYKIVEILLKY